MNIAALRLYAQKLSQTELTSPAEVVAHMGAMQAQDFAMSKWAVGLRLPGSIEKDMDEALGRGSIIRTHVLRPTWHLLAAEDLGWMLGLTAQNIKALMKARLKELELTPEVLKKSTGIFEKALKNDQHLAREELMGLLLRAGIQSNENRSSHLLMWAELEGLICSGAPKGNKHTYALTGERITGKAVSLSREEALGKLAERYFKSHGPATLADFTWWSGLSIKDARNAVESVKGKFLSETVGEQTYLLTEKTAGQTVITTGTLLLPAFDELIISYRDRTAILTKEEHAKAISSNGLFRPVILVNGKVKGLWKRTVKKEKVFIETELFGKLTAKENKELEEAREAFGKFLGKSL